MSLTDVSDITDLNKTDEIWLLLVRRIRGYVQNERGKAARPYMFILYEIAPNTILRNQKILQKRIGRFPHPEKAFKFLVATMRQPLEELKQPPHRPQSVIFTSKILYNALAKTINDRLRVVPKYWTEEENQGFGDDFVDRYSKKLVDKQGFVAMKASLKPGVLSIPEVEPTLVADLYKAAAEYFREFPWKKFSFAQIFTISWMKEIRFFIVSGSNGQEQGLIMETSWEDTKGLILSGSHPKKDTEDQYRAILFVSEESMPFGDLEAQERYGWELAHPDKKHKKPDEKSEKAEEKAEEKEDEWENPYPLPVSFPQVPPQIDQANQPSRRDLVWFELALKIIAGFAKTYVKPVVDEPVKKKSEGEDANEDEENEEELRKKYIPPAQPPVIENNKTVFSHAGKAIINFSFWSSTSQWDDLESHLSAETTRLNAPTCKVCAKVEDGNTVVLKKCAGCKQKLYCSRECQAADWKTHKAICQKN